LRMYGELRLLEDEMASARGSGRDMREVITRLDRLEEQANHLRVPVAYASQPYMLRNHIDLVREGVRKHNADARFLDRHVECRALSISQQGDRAERGDGFGAGSTARGRDADRNQDQPGGAGGPASGHAIPAAQRRERDPFGTEHFQSRQYISRRRGDRHAAELPRLNADHRQARFGENAVKPLRQRSSFQPNSLEAKSFRLTGHPHFPHNLARIIHMRAMLKARINKTDRNDARGIAQMMRVGLYRPVHVKTLRSQKLRMLLTHRKLLQSKAIAIENDLRASLRNFGLKVGMIGTVKFEARIRELVESLPDLAALVEPLLIVRRVLRERLGILHRRVLAVVRDDDVCRRLMTIPGVGPVVARTYRVTVDVPARVRDSKAGGAGVELAPAKYQTRENDRTGAISRCGDEMMRMMLYEAAQIMLVRSTKWSWLKAWAMKIARHRGMKKAIVALARRLAVIMHRIWVDGTDFRWTREVAAA